MRLAETLGEAIAHLELLNQNTEQDFLTIGGKLGEFVEAVDVISARSGALVNLISGTDASNTSRSLEVAFGCFTRMKTHYKDRRDGLFGMRQEVARLRHTLAEFEEIISSLNAIGFLTRIEIARLGITGADFGSLAADMKSLTADVDTKVKNALDTGVLLISPIESAMGDIAGLDETQVKDLASAFGNLAAFRDIQDMARDSSARLIARCDALSAAFGKLIVSIQFHDMTRQLVEHVIIVLRRLRSECEGENADSLHACGITAAVLELQSSQLADAAGKFAASVESVAYFLDNIANLIGEMVDESRNLSGDAMSGGDTTERDNTYFLQMERGCLAILRNVRFLATVDAATRITGVQMEENIGRMRGCVAEIGNIGRQMKQMALNATIVATHIGAPGDAINTLALSLGEKAAMSRGHSDSIFEVLGSMSEATGRLFGQRGPATAAMLAAVAELHTSGERSVARIAEIIDSGARLRDDLADARRGFTVGPVFAEAIARTRGLIDSAIKHEARNAQQSRGHSLDDFATHYTMQSERDVYERFTGVCAAAAAPEAAGDNVDFF